MIVERDEDLGVECRPHEDSGLSFWLRNTTKMAANQNK